MVPRSASPGLVQLTGTCVLPDVTVDDVTLLGDWLSMVIVAPAVSLPAGVFEPVQEQTNGATEYVAPAGTDMLACDFGVMRIL